jgi:hypothetical protein
MSSESQVLLSLDQVVFLHDPEIHVNYPRNNSETRNENGLSKLGDSPSFRSASRLSIVAFGPHLQSPRYSWRIGGGCSILLIAQFIWDISETYKVRQKTWLEASNSQFTSQM